MLEMGHHHRDIASSENSGYSNETSPILITTVNRSVIEIFNRSLEPKDQKGTESPIPHIGTYKNQRDMLSAAKHYIHDSLREQGITYKKKMRASFDSMEEIYKKYSHEINEIEVMNEGKKQNLLTSFRARMESGAVAQDIVSCLLVMHIFGLKGAEGLSWTVDILFDDNTTRPQFTDGNRHADRALQQIMRTAKVLLPQVYPEHPAMNELFQKYVNGLMQKILDKEFIDFSGRFDILETRSA